MCKLQLLKIRGDPCMIDRGFQFLVHASMLSATSDPYYVAKEEVDTTIKKVKTMHEEWQKLLQSENTANSRKFQELHAELVGELRQLEFDLQDVTATNELVEKNRAKFHLDDAEITSRKEFVKTSRTAVKSISDSLTSQQALAKMEADKKQVLASRQGNNRNDDRQAKVSRENESFLDNQRQEQSQILAQQDGQLAELSKSVQRLGDVSRTINVELKEQQQMLEELDEDIEKETEKLNFVMKRVGRLLKTSDNKQLCLIIGLFILAIVLLFLVINV